MDACIIYQLNCLKNIIEKFINYLIKNKCKLNNEKNVKQILLKIIKENPSILKNSFAFLFSIGTKNYAVSWNSDAETLNVNISTVCKPDSISLGIVDTYLKSELIIGDDFAKISCLFNKGKNSTLKQIFQVSATTEIDAVIWQLQGTDMLYGAVETFSQPPTTDVFRTGGSPTLFLTLKM